MLCGTHSENFIAQVDRKISLMGIHFRPGGGTAFFALPASELHNENISFTAQKRPCTPTVESPSVVMQSKLPKY